MQVDEEIGKVAQSVPVIICMYFVTLLKNIFSNNISFESTTTYLYFKTNLLFSILKQLICTVCGHCNLT